MYRIDTTTWDLASVAADCVADPLKFVFCSYPWGEPGTVLANDPGPDTWQVRVLEALGRACLGDGPRRIAVASGHGVGKTAMLAGMVLPWFLATRPHPQVIVTANTKAQLDGKTWRECSKWLQLSLFRDWFQWKASKVFHVEHPETWTATPVAWSKERPEAFAGTHEQHVLMIFDEASAIPDAIWDVAEGAMTTPGAFWLAFGNPTRNTGRFKECFPGGRFAHRWQTFQVDSRTARKADKEQLQAWCLDYGEDSDFVRVRVRGVFPRTSALQFIGEDLLQLAMQRQPAPDLSSPLLLGVDVARFGDDATVLTLRQGGVLPRTWVYRELSTMQIASRVAEVLEQYQPDACFIDVGNMGAGVIDRLHQLGYRREVVEVNFGAAAMDERHYANKRAEMWGACKAWLKDVGCLDPTAHATLAAELQGPEYGFDVRERIQLERKVDMKKRGLASPDAADSLCLTFAYPVAKRRDDRPPQNRLEFDPLAVGSRPRQGRTDFAVF